MSDNLDWPALRVRWLRQVAVDPMVPDWAYRVAFLVAGCVNSKTLEAWSQPAKLYRRFHSKKFGWRKDTIKRSLQLLVQSGHLEERFGKDEPPHKTLCYAVIVRAAADAIATNEGVPQTSRTLAARLQRSTTDRHP
jgi:hypothetical protein